MTDKATPRPWIWEGDFKFTNSGARIVTDKNGNAVAHVLTVAERKRSTPYNAPDSGRDANAALIVRAVNAHDGLVAALRTLANNQLSDDNCADVATAGKRVRNIAAAALRAAGVEP